MFFKPRIFISSLLRGSIGKRKNIDKLLRSCGAEVILYEKNLTPSVNTNTYRRDILEADFVILILDENYGALTENGISGSEEEFDIATENSLKTHVYIKNAKTNSRKEDKFIKKIKETGISYYFYTTDEELYNRIQETVMTIAKEITLNSITKEKMDWIIVKKLAQNSDYELACNFIRRHSLFKGLCQSDRFLEINTNMVFALFEFPINYISKYPFLFIDTKYGDLLLDAYKPIKAFMEKHSMEFEYSNDLYSINDTSDKWGDVKVAKCCANKRDIDYDWYFGKIEEYMNLFKLFTEYAGCRRLEEDSHGWLYATDRFVQ